MSTFSSLTLSDGSVVPSPAYGAGTAWFACEADQDTPHRELVDSVKLAIQAGFTHIDAAEAYKNSSSIGLAIRESGVPRSKLYITTKMATGFKSGQGRASFLKELARLGVDYVDLLLIHWPYELGKDDFPTHEEAWTMLEGFKDEGLVKSIGVSNYRIKDLETTLKIAKHAITVNQIESHPYVLETSRPLLAFMKQHNIVIEAYAPTAPLNKFPGGPLDPVLTSIATAMSTRSSKNVVPSQVLLKFTEHLGAVVVTTSGKEWRMQEQLAAGGIPSLTAEEVESIESASKDHYKRVYMPHMQEI